MNGQRQASENSGGMATTTDTGAQNATGTENTRLPRSHRRHRLLSRQMRKETVEERDCDRH